MPARHILIPIHDFAAGGTELIAFSLAREWLKAGRRVSILAGAADGPLRPRVPEGVDVHLLAPERPRWLLSRAFLGRPMADAARTLAPDAVFIPGNFHFVLGRDLRRALPRAAIVAKASNPIWSDEIVPFPIVRSLVGWGTQGIDRIVAMTQELEPEAARYVGAGRVTSINDPFIADDLVIHARAGTPKQAGISSQDRQPLRLLSVARLETQKDPMLALATLAALRQGGLDAHLTMVGDGSMDEAVRAEIARLGLGDAVTLVGYVADPTPFYEAADLFLVTSRFEGGPAVVGEALMQGVPFVATDCSRWLRQLAATAPLGTLVADRSAAALAAAIRQRAGERYPTAQEIDAGLAKHRVGPAARAYLDLFDNLLDQAAGSGRAS